MADVITRFEALPDRLPPEEYNFTHFRTKHVVSDVRRSIGASGIRPGQAAPDFELPRAGGGSIRLTELRGKPVLLHFASFT
ncbi:MAG TPA: redoxin domain-containing protein [Bryobacteraceae bacterium]|nr:redoxin domain-containing protein [Bryobacteraceae bacterium]